MDLHEDDAFMGLFLGDAGDDFDGMDLDSPRAGAGGAEVLTNAAVEQKKAPPWSRPNKPEVHARTRRPGMTEFGVRNKEGKIISLLARFAKKWRRWPSRNGLEVQPGDDLDRWCFTLCADEAGGFALTGESHEQNMDDWAAIEGWAQMAYPGHPWVTGFLAALRREGEPGVPVLDTMPDDCMFEPLPKIILVTMLQVYVAKLGERIVLGSRGEWGGALEYVGRGVTQSTVKHISSGSW